MKGDRLMHDNFFIMLLRSTNEFFDAERDWHTDLLVQKELIGCSNNSLECLANLIVIIGSIQYFFNKEVEAIA